LTEEIKWSVPVYTQNGKNIATVNALKESATLDFLRVTYQLKNINSFNNKVIYNQPGLKNSLLRRKFIKQQMFCVPALQKQQPKNKSLVNSKIYD